MNGHPVLGIDLGTSFSTACVWVDGRPVFITDGRNEASIPSVVHFPKRGAPIVGSDADKMRIVDPTNTVSGVKRLLGCASKESPAARLVDAISAYKLVDSSDGVSVSVRSGILPATEVASLIIRYLKSRAELRFGKGIRRAVITHPVKASPEAIRATILAAKLADLEVIRTVPEPVAGALYACSGSDQKPRRVVVFDFGGGTLDVSVLEQKHTMFCVLASGGDELLGGDDFDRAMVERIADVVWRSRGVELRHDAIQWASLHRRCELAKRALSVSAEARVHLDDVALGGTELLVERTDMEHCWRSLVDRALEETAKTIMNAGMRPRDLGAMVTIGGTTYIPLVRRSLDRVLDLPAITADDPQTAVAAGAAMIGAQAVELKSA